MPWLLPVPRTKRRAGAMVAARALAKKRRGRTETERQTGLTRATCSHPRLVKDFARPQTPKRPDPHFLWEGAKSSRELGSACNPDKTRGIDAQTNEGAPIFALKVA